MLVRQTSNSLSLLLKLQKVKKLQAVSLLLQKYVYILQIRFTVNNFYLTISDYLGNLLLSQSGGMLKIPSVTKKSSFRFELTLLHILKRALHFNISYFILRLDTCLVKKKQLILKLLQQFKFNVIAIHAVCLQTFNGVRLAKRRRL